MNRALLTVFGLFTLIFFSGCAVDRSFITRDGLIDRNYEFEETPYYPNTTLTRNAATDLFVDRKATVFVHKNKDADFTKIDKVYIAPVKIVSPESERIVGKARLYKKIIAHYQAGLKRELGKVVELVDKPSDDTAIVRTAISSIQLEYSPLKIYQYIPVSLAIQTLKRTTGFEDKEIRAVSEVRIDHKKLGEPMIIAAFTNTIGRAKNEEAATEDDVKDALDAWAYRIATRLKELIDGNSKLK